MADELDEQPGAQATPRPPLLGRAGAVVVSVIFVFATLLPVKENWRERPKDSFPLSYYPMFTQKRGESYEVSYLVGVEADGEKRNLPYRLAGGGGFNQVRRQINKTISQDRADELARAVAGEAARRGAVRRPG